MQIHLYVIFLQDLTSLGGNVHVTVTSEGDRDCSFCTVRIITPLLLKEILISVKFAGVFLDSNT